MFDMDIINNFDTKIKKRTCQVHFCHVEGLKFIIMHTRLLS